MEHVPIGVFVLDEESRASALSPRMVSIGRLVASVAHEINNPMAYVRANLSSIDRQRQAMQQDCGRMGHPSDESKRQEALDIADDGPGVPPEARTHLFDPFFTVRECSGATGLGVYIAYQTVRSLGGDLRCADVFNQKRSGAQFEVILPIA